MIEGQAPDHLVQYEAKQATQEPGVANTYSIPLSPDAGVPQSFVDQAKQIINNQQRVPGLDFVNQSPEDMPKPEKDFSAPVTDEISSRSNEKF